jgi:threonine synthase
VLLDPHTAVAFAAADNFIKSGKLSCGHIVILATGHPAREANLVKTATGQELPLPEKLSLLRIESDPIAVIEPRLGALEGVLASCL